MTTTHFAALAHHEAGHAVLAEVLGHAAVPYLFTTGRGICYIGDGRPIAAEAWRLICCAGPVAQLRHQRGPLTARVAWHSWCAGELRSLCTASDLAGMGPPTHRLVARTAQHVEQHWPTIARMSATMLRMGPCDPTEVLQK